MLYTIGTEKELARINLHLPTQVFTELLQGIIILDAEYGKDRDYLKVGGYSVILETAEDVLQFKEIVDYDAHPCEWATKIGKDTGFVSALYLLNDDFVVVVYLPQNITPEAILKDLEEGI